MMQPGVKFYVLRYHKDVVQKDIPRLSATDRLRIKQAIETKLANNPLLFGVPLRTSLAGYRKLRIGNYRAVFGIEKETVKILGIMHRSVIYEKIEKREW
jgi:mRNA interferase RelE/StbE